MNEYSKYEFTETQVELIKEEMSGIVTLDIYLDDIEYEFDMVDDNDMAKRFGETLKTALEFRDNIHQNLPFVGDYQVLVENNFDEFIPIDIISLAKYFY